MLLFYEIFQFSHVKEHEVTDRRVFPELADVPD